MTLGRLYPFFRSSVFVYEKSEEQNTRTHSFIHHSLIELSTEGLLCQAVLDVEDAVIKKDGPCLHGARSLVREADRQFFV